MREHRLREIYDECQDYVRSIERDGLTTAMDVSEFWTTEFRDGRRVNYPDFNAMLAMRRGATYPLADSPAGVGEPAERRQAEAAYAVISQTVPTEYLHSIDESAIGAPWMFNFDGRMLSAGAIVNALTSYRINHWVATRLQGRPLRVLEIGAGYGQLADQLLRQLPIERYVICDLPQNLFLSSYYLQANFPEREAAFIRGDMPVRDTALTFLVPLFLQKLTGPFDLIINSYSFQEMTIESVNEYFAFARAALSDDGMLYSLNAHGKSGVELPSDYPIDGFQLAAFGAVRRFPHHYVFATNPYEMVLVPQAGGHTVADTLKLHLDALGGCFQLGLDLELAEMNERFVERRLDRSREQWLSAVGRFWRAKDAVAKRQALDEAAATGLAANAIAFVRGCLAFANGAEVDATRDLEAALSMLSRSHARVLTCLMLSSIHRAAGDLRAAERVLAEAAALVPWLRQELEAWSDGSSLPTMMAEQLRVDLPNRQAAPPRAAVAEPLLMRMRRTGKRFLAGASR